MQRNFQIMILRILAIICLALALMNPEISLFSSSGKIPVLIDVSDSMAPEAADQLLDSLRASPEADTFEIVPFASTTAPYPVPLKRVSSFRALQGSWGSLNVGGSNVAHALDAMKMQGPVLLVSDGFENGGDVFSVTDSLRRRGVRVYPQIPGQSYGEPSLFRIVQLHAPLTAPLHTSVPIRVGVQNSTKASQSGTIVIYHGARELLKEKVTLEPGKEKLLTAQSDGSLNGVQEVRAELIPDTSSLGRSSEVTFISGAQREKILLLSGSQDDERILKQAFSDQSFQLDSMIATAAPLVIPDMQEYAGIIFNNVSLKQMASNIPQGIKDYVSAGGGFLMIGGERSFGLGGYRDTPIEQVLPVYVMPPETEQKRLNVGVSLVLDKSQSMAERDKIAFVQEAAKQVVKNLKDDDYLSIIGFDTSPFVVLPSSRVGGARELALSQIGNLFPTKSTRLMPALQTAARELERTPAGRKHMIVLTDGKLPDAGPMYIEATKQYRMLGITISTILLGEDSNAYPLEEMAQVGGGTFYKTSDPNMLPKVFLNDIKVSTGERTLKEASVYDVQKGPAGILSTALRSFPQVKGYVQTKMKNEGLLELVAYNGQTAEPLLASWKYGKGRTIAFTSDANGRWSSTWVVWEKFRAFWTELMQSLSESGESGKGVQFELRPYVERGQVKLDLAVFSKNAGGVVTAALHTPDGQSRDIAFDRLAEGHFEHAIDKPTAGRYEVHISAGKQKLTPVTFNVSGESFGEQKGKGFNAGVLDRIAHETGGAVNPPLSEFSAEKTKQPKRFDQVFLLLALAFLALEIYIREARSTFRS